MTEFIGSVKYQKNHINSDYYEPYTDITLIDAFLSKSNICKLIKLLYFNHREQGGKSTLKLFIKTVPKLASKFVIDENMHNYEYINGSNWVQELKHANTRFTNQYRTLFRWKPGHHCPLMNPFRQQYQVSRINEWDNITEQKRGDMLLADDIKQLDVWKPYQIDRSNRNFRYKNKIPIWQKSMQIRHYDRSNEGLTYSRENSEREGIIRGYNMSSIYNTSVYQ